MRAVTLPKAVQAESRAIVRPKAHRIEEPNHEDLQSSAEVASKRELLIALIAVLITFASAIPIVMLRPTVTEWMRWDDRALQHPREFLSTPEGGTIRYSPPAAHGIGQLSIGAVGEYVSDLSLLERRFRRGQFQMTGIPGGESGREYSAMRKHAGELSYRVTAGTGGASLTIVARTPQARQALAEYLLLLKERWSVGR